MNTAALLQQLQDKLIKKYDELKVELPQEELEELFGPFDNQSYLSFDNTSDVDEPEAVNTPYVTHRPFALPKGTKRGNIRPVKEAKDTDEDDIPAEDEAAMAADAGEEATEEATGEEMDPEGAEGMEGEAGGDEGEMGAGDMPDDMSGGDMGDTGMDMGGDQEEEKDPTELGRIYELKKIYARLTSIESYLGNESDQELLQIRNYVSQGIELFEIVSANFNSYKDRLNEIIVMYYKFLLEVYNSVKTYYGKEKK